MTLMINEHDRAARSRGLPYQLDCENNRVCDPSYVYTNSLFNGIKAKGPVALSPVDKSTTVYSHSRREICLCGRGYILCRYIQAEQQGYTGL